MSSLVCLACGGPVDILHTDTECRQIQAAAGDTAVDRYYLSVIAQIIDKSPSGMAAAYKLYTDGFLTAPRRMS
jgi:hypothetical protein